MNKPVIVPPAPAAVLCLYVHFMRGVDVFAHDLVIEQTTAERADENTAIPEGHLHSYKHDGEQIYFSTTKIS